MSGHHKQNENEVKWKNQKQKPQQTQSPKPLPPSSKSLPSWNRTIAWIREYFSFAAPPQPPNAPLFVWCLICFSLQQGGQTKPRKWMESASCRAAWSGRVLRISVEPAPFPGPADVTHWSGKLHQTYSCNPTLWLIWSVISPVFHFNRCDYSAVAGLSDLIKINFWVKDLADFRVKSRHQVWRPGAAVNHLQGGPGPCSAISHSHLSKFIISSIA